jgi:ATP-dependent RNA helicase DDX19/DBP5
MDPQLSVKQNPFDMFEVLGEVCPETGRRRPFETGLPSTASIASTAAAPPNPFAVEDTQNPTTKESGPAGALPTADVSQTAALQPEAKAWTPTAAVATVPTAQPAVAAAEGVAIADAGPLTSSESVGVVEVVAADVTDEKAEVQQTQKAALDMSALSLGTAADTMNDEEYKKRLTIIQADPNSRLCAAKKFEDLNLTPELLKGVFEMGFDRPSRIQEHAVPMILADPALNGICQAQAGSGKTVAFVLGMLSRCDPSLKECQAMCVAPTRELAEQSYRVAETMGKYTGLTFQRAMQNYDIPRGTKVANSIVIGTPGRVESWFKKNVINPKFMKIFVLDEADVMVQKSGNESSTKHIITSLPRTCQLLLFSATFPEHVHKYANQILQKQNVQHGGKCNEIKVKSDEELILTEIKQFKMDTRAVGKMQVLSDIYSVLDLHMSIIFVETKATADALTAHMEAAGFPVSKLHGNLQPAERDQVMEKFRQFKTKVLITTNVLARGVDVPGVNLVVNYDALSTAEGVPGCETYLHRIVRCGRFDRKGVAISFVNSATDNTAYAEAERHFTFKLNEAPADDVEALEGLIKAELGA